MPTELSPAGIAMLERLEGVRLEMYHDSIGLPTIGVGHKLTPSELSSGLIVISETPVPWTNGLLAAQVNELLAQDSLWAENAVVDAVKVPLTQPQFDALASFTFNVGAEALRHSGLLVDLNAGRYPLVPDHMRQWINAGGKPSDILKARRETEIAMWNTPA